MGSIRIGGWDPALANSGMAKGDLDLDTGVFTPIGLKLVKTASSPNKSIRVNSDDRRRAKEIFTGIKEFFSDVDIVCVEMPVGSQSSRAQTSYGVSVGIAACIELPLIECTASQIKLAVTGIKTASKDAMIAAMHKEYPELNWLTQKSKGNIRLIGDNEHLADALGAIHAGVKTEQFEELLVIFKSIKRS